MDADIAGSRGPIALVAGAPQDPAMDCKYDELSRALSVEEIVRLTRDFLLSWTGAELDRLPDSCRPARVEGARDIEIWADRLQSTAPRPLFLDDERKLDRMASHFLIASVRMRQLGSGRA